MIRHGDCLEVMATLDAESVSAVVTDPPYGLEFMGKEWDRLDMVGHASRLVDGQKGAKSRGLAGNFRRAELAPKMREMQQWHERWAVEAFRLAKPGAHLLSFGGTRTVHRLTCAIEDAGWEIRDCLVWGYASGFPKSLDVAKAIDKAAGHWRGRAGDVVVLDQPAKGTEYERSDKGEPVTAATAAAAAAAGWGTALKPAWEPIVMARKPLRGTVAANWQAHGTGALNVDATRIAYASDDDREATAVRNNWGDRVWPGPAAIEVGERPLNVTHDLGRWPANVILTDPIFDGGIEGVVGGGETASGLVRAGSAIAHDDGERATYGDFGGMVRTADTYGDSGTYSRFFLIPKADRAEREPVGLRTFDRSRETAHRRTGDMDTPYLRGETLRRNTHPTVKPVDLMRHLVRLVTPPGGIVLDPFLGSGTTGIACEMEGFEWIGIEREAEYVAIAEARLHGVQKGMGLSA